MVHDESESNQENDESLKKPLNKLLLQSNSVRLMDDTSSDVTPSNVIFYTFHLQTVKPSGSYTFGDFTYWMLHLGDVSPSGC